MGSPKPLLDWGGETLIEYQLRQLREAGADPVIVVLGCRAEEIAPLVRDGRVVVNEGYASGRASSLRLGAAEVPDETEAIIVLGVDQPRPASLLRRLVEERAAEGALIAVPVHQGRRGHPPVLDGRLLLELRQVRDETLGLREVLQRHESEIIEVECGTPLVTLDINTPEDYERARAYFEKVTW